MRIVPLAAVLALALSGSALCEESFGIMTALFDYDATQSLDVQVTRSDTLDAYGVRVEHINFLSPVAGRITALVVLPPDAAATNEGGASRGAAGGSRAHAGIVFLHWGQGDQSEFVWEAVMYARAGAVSVLLDAPWARPKPWKQPGESMVNPDADRQMYIQNVKDVRRSVDLLLSRGDVDPGRIAYVGHSFGATQGGLVAGVEKRIKTFVLMGGLPTLTDRTPSGARKFDDLCDLLAQYLTTEQLQKYDEVIGPLSPVNFIAHSSPAPVLMQFGLYDSWISKAAAERYFAAAGEPKVVKWYATSHEFTDLAATLDRARWLEKEIGLASIEPDLRGLLK